jgi:signal transduction histidine kinase
LEVDATGTITFQNDATTALLMRLKQDARALLPPDLPEILQSFARQEAEMVCREVGIDGVILEENIHRVPQYNAARIYAIDITERKRAEELSQALNAINTVIHSTLNLDDIMQTAVSAAARALGCVSAAVSLRQQARWIVSYAHGFPQDIVGVEMNDQEEPHAVLAIQTKRVVAISDTNRDERVNRAHMQKWGIRATLVAPLITKDEVTGIAFFNYRQAPFVFEQRHLDFASQLAASLALALENARLYREARALNEELDQRVAQRTSELENVNRQLESAVAQHQRATEQLRQLAAHIESAREEERIRIAREIHDELGTLMTAIKMDLAFLRREIGGDGAPQSPQALREQIHATTKLVDNAIESVHQIARELRPGVLDHLGLRAALEWQMQEFQSRAKIECQFCSDLDELPVEPAHATAVFRILQEALTNVARHAQATRVEASLRKESTCLVLQVRDNGKGFSKAQIANGHALGLLGMRERALAFGGEVFFQTAPGQGTVVTVRLPLP